MRKMYMFTYHHDDSWTIDNSSILVVDIHHSMVFSDRQSLYEVKLSLENTFQLNPQSDKRVLKFHLDGVFFGN